MPTPSPFAPTPSSSSSRRASVSSVTSSGRRRKDQSLLDVAESLGQRTPERSEFGDEGVPARSRQLDFGSVDGDEGEQEQVQQQEVDNADTEQEAEADEQTDNADGGQEAAAEETPNEEVENPTRRRRTAAAPRMARAGRRVTVFWSAEEEDFLRRGVAKYGVGKWKKILTDGQNVFSSHRTNVDLKDKWKNLQSSHLTNRKRRRGSGSTNPSDDATEIKEGAELQSAANTDESPRDDISEISWPDSIAQRPRRKAPAVANGSAASTNKKNSNVKVNQVSDRVTGATSRLVELRFVTDKQIVPVSVDLTLCSDVAALKQHLRLSVLSDTPDADVQVIGIESRVLCEDHEPLAQCIRQNGAEYYLVVEESAEEFV